MLKANYDWKVSSDQLTDLDQENIAQLKEVLDLPDLLVDLLYQRGFQDEEAINHFLDEEPIIHDPFLLSDMDRAVDRLMAAIEAGQAILVYGDYDADGITAATILVEGLENMGANVHSYLPDRFVDGYGPNKDVYNYYIKQGIQVILTCDNGVKGHEAIAHAQAQGVDVIVTDHHEMADSLPDAYAIVHPRHPDQAYPFDDLSGAGVALKVVQALTGALPIDLLDLCAIGTVADLVSLTDENRSLVKLGLQQLKQTQRLAFIRLFEKLEISPSQIDEETIGFKIAPRLNALGRLSDANLGLQLLMSFDPDEVDEGLQEMEAINDERRALVDQIEAEARAEVDQRDHLDDILVCWQDDWHEGVLGIVASRLVERYQRPCLVLTHKTDQALYKGSGRSVQGVNLFDLLSQLDDQMLAFGGHAMAAGLTIGEAKFADWQSGLQELGESIHEIVQRPAPLDLDGRLQPAAVNLVSLEALQGLKPFGTDNPKPRFLLEAGPISRIQQLGRDKQTLKLGLAEAADLSLIGFRMGKFAQQLSLGNPLEAAVGLSINEWQGKRSPQAFLLDMRVDEASVIDLRQARAREEVFAVEEAYYLFQEAKYLAAYQDQIPSSSRGILVDELDQDLGEGYQQAVLFDCPQDLEAIRRFVQERGIKNLYLFAYSPKQVYLNGLPQREDFERYYRYLLGHPQLPLKGQAGVLASYLKLAEGQLVLMTDILEEAGLVAWQGDMLHILPVQGKVDLKAYLTKYEQVLNSEQVLLYNDIESIRNYFFAS
ncbi:single-stranded-DNA-specific exonuclease RecJ [Aerococcus sanguinicola]|uniref:Single-stranded-DNA-specific exonuclease RecJ n=1 Tax=Aerococcus sanguinicola TaxID=119206 RepID=A0A5N1GNL7_9LACT|nr:single-stranded-DNA-specific exonuclease RecJ [Aerococcus sanguinicola]KAA9301859.1 single-stranded-DNA-specific exonuclease RecJ [Aerococcus sanguinicola]